MNDLRLIAAKIWSSHVTIDGSQIRQRLTWQEILESNQYRDKVRNTLKYGDFISEDYINYLCSVPHDVDEQIDKLYDLIKTGQMAVYRFFSDEKRVEKEKKKLTSIRGKITDLQTLKWRASAYTMEGQLDRLQEEYEFRFRCSNAELLTKYIAYIPSISEVRELARSQWYQQYHENTTVPEFDGPFTDIQSNLLSHVAQYKNVYELSERPSFEIIDDDDAFDGWALVQSKKQETAPKQNSKHQGKQHVFQFASSPEEAEQIYLSNDGNAGKKQQAQLKELNEKGFIVNR